MSPKPVLSDRANSVVAIVALVIGLALVLSINALDRRERTCVARGGTAQACAALIFGNR